MHYRLLIQQAMPLLLSSFRSSGSGIDLAVCDMCVEPLAIYSLITGMADAIKPAAPLVLTLKFQKRLSEAAIQVQWQHIRKALEVHFRDISLVWLFANTQSERTVLAYKK